MLNLKYYLKHYNYPFLLMVFALGLIGTFCIRLSDGDYMFKKQIFGLLSGLILVIIVSLIDYHFIEKFVILYYLAAIAMLLLVRFTPLGVDHGTGAFRWIDLGFLEIQPSELCKIILILVLAVFFKTFRKKMDKFWVFLLACVIMAIPAFLIVIQTDLSSGLVMVFIFTIMIFVAGLSYKIIIPVVTIGLPAFLALFWYVQQPYQILLKEWQQNRILGILNPERYAKSLMFQQNSSVQAISSGKLYGKMLMNGSGDYRKYSTVWVNESDFIFSVIGEEFGFIGSCIVIVLLMLVVIQCISIARKADDFTGMLIAVGVSAMFMFQTFANIGVSTSILPNTGLPLPFISYGLTSLWSNMIAVGLVINVGLRKNKIRG